MTKAYKHRLLRRAAVYFGSLLLLLMACTQVLQKKQFAIAALVLIPVSAIAFNLYERRAFAAHLATKR